MRALLLRWLPPAAVWAACLLAAALLVPRAAETWALQSDRPAQALAWAPSSPEARLALAEAAAKFGDDPEAARLARSLLADHPYDVSALRLLARSAADRGDADAQRLILRRAGRLSLRDTFVHLWLLDDELDRRDYPAAFVHADSLLRRRSQAEGQVLFRLTRAMEDPAARVAMAAALADGPDWRGRFLANLGHTAFPGESAALLTLLARRGVPPDAETAPTFDRMVSLGEYPQAAALWSRLYGPSAGPGVYDGAFLGKPGPPPLNWQVIRQPGSETELVAGGPGEGHLALRHDLFSDSRSLARQLLLLTAGPWRITASARTPEPGSDGRFRLRIVCVGGRELGRVGLRGGDNALGLEVPTDGCPAQWLEFVPITGDRPEPAALRIDRVVAARREAAL